MSEELQQEYNRYAGPTLKVYEIFKDFFGEDRVDLQGLLTLEKTEEAVREGSFSLAGLKRWLRTVPIDINILVHFPRVKVTNEYDKFTFVNHLYAKVKIDISGKLVGKFSLNRAEYTVQHFTNNYMHSHVCDIPIGDLTQFQIPCTGTGPINHTICSLNHEFDEDLWRLFCLELDKFVQVESVAGTPYHRLEQLRDRQRSYSRVAPTIRLVNNFDFYWLGRSRSPILNLAHFASFTKYLIDKEVLRFSFINGKYIPGMSPIEYTVLISNAFIDWYNREFSAGRITATRQELEGQTILCRCKFSEGKLWKVGNSYNHLDDYMRYSGAFICNFKGTRVRLSFSDATGPQAEENELLILNPNIASYIINKILNVVNFRYGNKNQSPNQKGVCYL